MKKTLLMGIAIAATLSVAAALPAKADTITDDFTFTSVSRTDGADITSGVFQVDTTTGIATFTAGNVVGFGNDNSINGPITGTVLPTPTNQAALSIDFLWDGKVPFTASGSSGVVFDIGSTLLGNLYASIDGSMTYLSTALGSGNDPAVSGGGPTNPGILGVFAIQETPLPAALPMMATGLLGLGGLLMRRKRKATALATA